MIRPKQQVEIASPIIEMIFLPNLSPRALKMSYPAQLAKKAVMIIKVIDVLSH
jgi:hypothetical protein